MIQDKVTIQRTRRMHLIINIYLFIGSIAFFFPVMFAIYYSSSFIFSGIPLSFPWNVLTSGFVFSLLVVCIYNGFYFLSKWLIQRPGSKILSRFRRNSFQDNDEIMHRRRKHLLTIGCLFGCLILLLIVWLWFTCNTFSSFFDPLAMSFPWNVLVLSLIFTYMLVCLYHGFYLVINWLRHKPKYLKVISIVLFPITMAFAYFGGALSILPYIVFCVYKAHVYE